MEENKFVDKSCCFTKEEGEITGIERTDEYELSQFEFTSCFPLADKVINLVTTY